MAKFNEFLLQIRLERETGDSMTKLKNIPFSPDILKKILGKHIQELQFFKS